MSRFNAAAINPRRTTNHEHEVAYTALDNEQQLYALTAADFLTNSFYSTEKQKKEQVRDLIAKCDPIFVGKLAVYIRKELYLRTMPIYMIASLASIGRVQPWMVTDVIQRVDEIKELCGAWMEITGAATLKKFPHAMEKGLKRAFLKFGAFQFRKYNKGGKETITFKDVMRLVHPKPLTEAQSFTFKSIKEDNLPPIETWETELSAGDGTKKEIWERLIREDKIPYMALLRNIRNIVKAKVDDSYISTMLERLTDEQAVLKSKQFPFRWYSAAKMLFQEPDCQMYYNQIEAAMETAIQHSIANIPGFDKLKDERILIACDVSGSMHHPLSDKSSIYIIEIGILMGRMLSSKCRKVITGVFGNEWAPVPFGTRVLAPEMKVPEVGLATYGYKVIQWAISNNYTFDRMVFFSDNQIYSDLGMHTRAGYGYGNATQNRSAFETTLNRYKRDVNADVKLYLMDLAGYGDFPVDLIQPNTYMVSGWSPSVFRVLDELGTWKEFRKRIIQ